MLVNLTPHPINLFVNGALVSTILPESVPARCEQSQELVETWLSIPITRQKFGKVENLPEPKEGTRFIVSRLVAEACQERTDLLIPGPCVRDQSGRVIGCEGLSIL